MIDIGCGTGILSITAAKLGVKEVIGLDIDQDAINISRLNAANNQVEEATRFLQESIEELMMGGLVPSHAPLVIANIIAPTLTKLFEEGLAKLVSPRGTLILSGILEGQHPEIITQMENAGFKHQSTLQQDEWVALIGTKL
jgi:ribosomal protein L11 methyltransferase